MGNCNHGYNTIYEFIPDRVRKAVENVKTEAVIACRPKFGPIRQIIDGSYDQGAEGICSNRAAFDVPEECLAELLFRFGQNFDGKPTHSALMRARASAQGEAETEPAWSMSLRRLSSLRHASATDASSLASRLSISAAAIAERSSAESWRAS